MKKHEHSWYVVWRGGLGRWLYRCYGCKEIGYGVPR